jgi:hypothetical protein
MRDRFAVSFTQWCDRCTHNANLRCVKHLKRAFAIRRLIDVGPDDIEAYLRERLCQSVKVKTSKGFRELGLFKGHNGTPRNAGASQNVEHCGQKKATDVESM